MSTVTTSKQFSLGWRDAGKAVLTAAASAGVGTLYTALTTTPINIDWKVVGISALTGGIGYLVKNFFTPSQTIIKADPPADH